MVKSLLRKAGDLGLIWPEDPWSRVHGYPPSILPENPMMRGA